MKSSRSLQRRHSAPDLLGPKQRTGSVGTPAIPDDALAPLASHSTATTPSRFRQSPRGGQPVARVGNTNEPTPARNQFRIRPANSKQEVDAELEKWLAYFTAKEAKLSAARKQAAGYSNFANVGEMIDVTKIKLEDLTDEDAQERVRFSINDEGNIAGIMLKEAEEERELDDPHHIDDLIANPKGLVPPKAPDELAEGVQRPPKPPGQKLIPGEKRSYKGGGRALLQHALDESGDDGISLWPFGAPHDATAGNRYRRMDFDGARFVGDNLLTLKPRKK